MLVVRVEGVFKGIFGLFLSHLGFLRNLCLIQEFEIKPLKLMYLYEIIAAVFLKVSFAVISSFLKRLLTTF